MTSDEDLYYIQNSGYSGNSMIFWRIGGHGYTCDLSEAWRVTKEEALIICRSRPTEDTPRQCSLIDSLACKQISIEKLWAYERKLKEEKVEGWVEDQQ